MLLADRTNSALANGVRRDIVSSATDLTASGKPEFIRRSFGRKVNHADE
jgi:hypothetical protein